MFRVISQLFVIIRKVQKHLALFLLRHTLCNGSELLSPKPMIFGYGSVFLHLASDLSAWDSLLMQKRPQGRKSALLQLEIRSAQSRSDFESALRASLFECTPHCLGLLPGSCLCD